MVRRWVWPGLRLVVFGVIALALVKLAFFGGLTAASDDTVPSASVGDSEVPVATATVRSNVTVAATITADPAVPVRATATGQVVKVLVATGQTVDQKTPVATVRVQPDVTNLPDGAAPPAARTVTLLSGAAGTVSDVPVLPGQDLSVGDAVAEVAPPTFSVVGTMPAEQQYRLMNRPTDGVVTVRNGPQPFTCSGLTITTPLPGAGAGTQAASTDGSSGGDTSSSAATTVRCAVPAGVTVFSGIAAKLRISGGVAEHALTVPVTAVEGAPGGAGTVWTTNSSGHTTARAVTLGMTNGKVVQVTNGLTSGDSVLEFVPDDDSGSGSGAGSASAVTSGANG